MEAPKHYVSEMIEVLKDHKMGWHYKDKKDHDSFFGGEAYEIVHSNIPFTENEILGIVDGYKFMGLNQKFVAELEKPIQKMKAVAVRCIDGAVLIAKWSFVEYQGDRRIEGYWYAESLPQYPKPIPNALSENDAKEIFDLIKIKEKEAEIAYSRGMSTSRIDGTSLGNSEFHHEDWLWPGDFAEHYVLKYKVKPSNDFLRFIGWL